MIATDAFRFRSSLLCCFCFYVCCLRAKVRSAAACILGRQAFSLSGCEGECCADDVVDLIWRVGARANLPTDWLPAAVAGGAFALLEPPTSASPWVPRLLGDARLFAHRLASLPSLQVAEREQVRRSLLAPLCGRLPQLHFPLTPSTLLPSGAGAEAQHTCHHSPAVPTRNDLGKIYCWRHSLLLRRR